ncbi:hypothetical protein P167DRAFT_605417 [Morchella conica CCBAS932]|uniref:Uncharacterized protein n=1 Tax=Morchella conica CCBAS932 TaxID=1392247 RepID=A0A3N4KQS6_9PEZI|nr:hypothetical protein P167DRAFT_605417 [Morchella conica CCBAS932]
MAQLNFAAIANHLHNVESEVALVPNMAQVAGFATMQQQIDAAQQEMNANHLEIVALFAQVQGQISQTQNEYAITLADEAVGTTLVLAVLHRFAAQSEYMKSSNCRKRAVTSSNLLCQAASAAFRLPALPVNVVVDARRRQIAEYIGVMH